MINRPGFIGHEVERDALAYVLDPAAPGAGVLLLEGEAGIGKTTLWRWAVELAASRSYLVLRCEPAETEATLPFSALADLLEPVLHTSDVALPGTQRLALETALAVTAPTQAFDRLAVSRAVLTLLRGLADRGRLLVAIDDIQWLDDATASVLDYALRRLVDTSMRVLLTRRSERDTPPPLSLDRTLGSAGFKRVRVRSFQPGELDSLLRTHLQLALPRPRLMELHRITGGNPFYALEIARSRQQQDGALPEVLAVPDSLASLVRARLEQLPPEAHYAVLVVAAASHPSFDLVQRAGVDRDALAEAIRRAVLEPQGARLRFVHPLLASVAYEAALPWEREAAHRALAEASLDLEEKALHLAFSTSEPDPRIAELIEAAAERAARRGAPSAAAGLSQHACRLTPLAAAHALRSRLARSGEYHLAAGDTARGIELLDEAIAHYSPGPERSGLLLRLGRARYIADDVTAAHAVFQQALMEAAGDLRLTAFAEQALAFTAMFGGDIGRALAHAQSSLRSAQRAGDPGLLALAQSRVAVEKFLAGQGLDLDLLEQAVRLESHLRDMPVEWLPRYVYAALSTWVADFDTARRLYGQLYQAAMEQADERSIPTVLFGMSQLESAAGNLETASRYGAEAVERARQGGLGSLQAYTLAVHAHVCALLGKTADARAAAEDGLQIAQRAGAVAPLTLLLAATGMLDVSLGEYAAAHARLGPLAGMLAQVGLGEPTVVRFLPDQIEALVALGELEQARPLVAALEERGLALDRPWAIATGARSAALLAAAEGDFDAAEQALARAFAALDRLPEPLEHGRTLLVAGTIARRGRSWRRAREYLGQALERFDTLGTALWAERAAAELARVPGRRQAGNELTEMERRVAAFVAQGLSNQEIAARLFVAVRTVEANISKLYAKLGVHSRVELAAHLPAPPSC